MTKEEIEKVKNDVLTKETKLLFVAPETLSKLNTIEFLKKITVSFIAIDEAHCISKWGASFRPDYEALCKLKIIFPLIKMKLLCLQVD